MVANAGCASSLLIVQPWFTVIGHPAQALFNTAQALGRRSDVAYLISRLRGGNEFDESARELERWGTVAVVPVPNNSLQIGTACATGTLAHLLRACSKESSILFLDSHPIVPGALAPLVHQPASNCSRSFPAMSRKSLAAVCRLTGFSCVGNFPPNSNEKV